MKFKESVKNEDSASMSSGAFGHVGTMSVECPSCGKRFSYSYGIKPLEPIPLPKVCPFCGEGLLEEDSDATAKQDEALRILVEGAGLRFVDAQGKTHFGPCPGCDVVLTIYDGTEGKQTFIDWLLEKAAEANRKEEADEINRN